MKAKSKGIYFDLFFTFFKIGLFTFGGGYAMLALIEREVVERKKWIQPLLMPRIVAISEVTPGPVSVNSATYIGCKKGGLLGAIMATLGVILPSLIIILIISIFINDLLSYPIVAAAFSGIRMGASVLICSVGIKMVVKMTKGYWQWALFAFALSVTVAGLFTDGISAVLLIIIGAIIGLGFLNYNSKERLL